MPIRISKNRVSLENIPLNEAKGADIASAATVNLDSATGNLVHITGTTTITAITLSSGYERTVVFDGALTLTHNATTLILPGNANITTASGDRAVFRGDGAGNTRCISYTKASGEAVVGSGNTYNLTNIVYPRADGDWRGIYRGGWRPAFFNQQWGGAQWGNGPDGSLTDFAAGYIDVPAGQAITDTAARTYIGQGFKTAEAVSPPAVWVKIYKVGNPTNNLGLYIYPDDGTGTKPTGSTPVTNGTATAQSGKLHTANSNGEWVRFVFATPPSLSANTFYHVVLKSSGAVDGSNYWLVMVNGGGDYPHGNYSQGDATPTWTAFTAYDMSFLIENSSTTKFLQSSGQFDGKLVFAEGNPLNQSKGLCQPLRNFFDGREFTYRGVFAGLTKDKTVADFVYGLDHDRVVLRCNATTGYMQVDVYESDGTKHTVTGTTDCSSGTKDIAIYIRAKGDGSDAVKLYVNGASEGTPISSATITFSTEFRDLGTAWIGGGFPVAPTWTKDTAMGSLPSADGWTYTGTATEGNVFSVSGGKLYQNKNGYAATDTGYYSRTTTLSNTNGWVVTWKVRVSKDSNTVDYEGADVVILDGTKGVRIYIHEYYIQTVLLATNYNIQLDMTRQEHTFVALGKGSDFFLFIDGQLAVDGTGLLTSATATNAIYFGDFGTVSGGNADAVWDYVKDYNTAWLPPQFTSGSLSEAAFFSGDRTGILASLYNGGTLKSAKEYCGIQNNYVKHVSKKLGSVQKRDRFSSTSTNYVSITDLNTFFISSGDTVTVRGNIAFGGDTATANIYIRLLFDGRPVVGNLEGSRSQATAALRVSADGQGTRFVKNDPINYEEDVCAGLHSVALVGSTNAGTFTINSHGPDDNDGTGVRLRSTISITES